MKEGQFKTSYQFTFKQVLPILKMTDMQNAETLIRENGFYQCKMCPRIFYTEVMIRLHTQNENQHKIEMQPANKNQVKIECQQYNEQNSTTNNKNELKPKNNSLYNTPISEESTNIGEEKIQLKSLPTESGNSYNLRSKPIKIQTENHTKPLNEFELSTEDVKELHFNQTTSTLKKEINLPHEKQKFVQSPYSDKSLPLDTYLQADKNKILVTNVPEKLECEECEKSFTKNCHLQAYWQKLQLKTQFSIVHSKMKRYLCPECPKSYGSNISLQDHIKTIHRKIKSYKCSFCPKSYGYRSLRDQHKRIHKKETGPLGRNQMTE